MLKVQGIDLTEARPPVIPVATTALSGAEPATGSLHLETSDQNTLRQRPAKN